MRPAQVWPPHPRPVVVAAHGTVQTRHDLIGAGGAGPPPPLEVGRLTGKPGTVVGATAARLPPVRRSGFFQPAPRRGGHPLAASGVRQAAVPVPLVADAPVKGSADEAVIIITPEPATPPWLVNIRPHRGGGLRDAVVAALRGVTVVRRGQRVAPAAAAAPAAVARLRPLRRVQVPRVGPAAQVLHEAGRVPGAGQADGVIPRAVPLGVAALRPP